MEALLKRISFFFLLLIHGYSTAQTTVSLRSAEAAADSLFRLKNYTGAAVGYATAIDLAGTATGSQIPKHLLRTIRRIRVTGSVTRSANHIIKKQATKKRPFMICCISETTGNS